MIRSILLLLIAFCIVPRFAAGQNLVFNGGFDEPNICTEYHAKCSPLGWFYVYATGPGWGYTPGINNSPYAIELFTARKKDATRSFWQTMLSEPVVPGQEYVAQIDIKAEKGMPNLEDIGVVLTDKMRFAIYANYRVPDEYVSFADASITKLGNNWYRLSKTCSFEDSFQVLVIGNFSPKRNLDILKERKSKDDYLVTTIDNFSFTKAGQPGVGAVTQVASGNNALKDSLYNIKDRHRGLHELANKKTILPVERRSESNPERLVTDTLVIPDIAFAFDSYDLNDRPSLVRQLQPLVRGKITKIIVEGFTDSAGSVGYNDTLSTRRAGTVASLLTSEFPIVKYVTESKGSGISTKYDDDGKNRRVEIIIYREPD
ncbi:MAG: OmpA family protein [Chitinophagaceae bacterium]|nr:MAG: OmpA family protein [Chitinophagaceae bacterium]